MSSDRLLSSASESQSNWSLSHPPPYTPPTCPHGLSIPHSGVTCISLKTQFNVQAGRCQPPSNCPQIFPGGARGTPRLYHAPSHCTPSPRRIVLLQAPERGLPRTRAVCQRPPFPPPPDSRAHACSEAQQEEEMQTGPLEGNPGQSTLPWHLSALLCASEASRRD